MIPTILLASKSPRRHQLLRESGIPFEQVLFDVEESFPHELIKGEVAEFLCRKKSAAYEGSLENKILITADTIVCLDKRVINKPESPEEAFQMLSDLSGRMHEVFTGVCLRAADKQLVFADRTEVYFNEIPEAARWYYIEQYKPFDRAGSYGIQDWLGYHFVKGVQGCYYNVMGLPVSRVIAGLGSLGYPSGY